MKIIVLGGAGRVGRRIAEMLVARDLGEVTIADRAVPPEMGGRRVEVDIGDGAALRAALSGQDVVVNTVGPFDRWGAAVLTAAIETQTDYLDICDDPGPTADLLAFDSAARDAGVRAVVGMGASPGLTNLLAVVAARRLDETDTLAAFWGDPSEDIPADQAEAYARKLAAAFRSGRAALEHLIVQVSGTVPVWRSGAAADVKPWTAPYRVELSTGEAGTFRLVGHPEPVTLPRFVAADDVMCIGTTGKAVDEILIDLAAQVSGGALGITAAVAELADRIEKDPSALVGRPEAPPLPALIGAVAAGRRGGEERTVVALPSGPTDGSMSVETARPAVLGVELLPTVSPGVHPPEGAYDPDQFLSAFSTREWGEAQPYRLDDRPGLHLRMTP